MRTYYIYKVENTVNKKIYIGCTCRLKQRIHEHKRCYEKEKCDFHDDIIKYGKEVFVWEIIDVANSKEEAYALEKKYIKQYDSLNNGYNMTSGGAGNTLWNIRKVVRLSLSGEYIDEFESAAEAERKIGIHNSDIIANCRGKQKNTCGFMFMYKEDYLSNGPKEYTKPVYKTKKVIQCDLKGNFIAKFDSVTEASEKTNTHRPTLSSNLSKRYKSANGFIFVYEDEFPIKDINQYKIDKKGRKIHQVDPKTNEIINSFDRIKEAGTYLGVNYKTIHKVVDKPLRTAYGYKWISQQVNTEVSN